MLSSRSNIAGISASIIWQVFFSFSFFAIIPIIDVIGKEFSLNLAQMGLFTSSLYLGAAVLSIPAGRLSDRWGIDKALFGGLGMIGACILLFSITKIYWIALIITFIIGLGYSIVGPATNKLLMNYSPLGARGTAMGIKQMGIPGGSFLATVVIGGLAFVYEWRLALLITGVAIIILAFILFRISQGLSIGISKSPNTFEALFKSKHLFQLLRLSLIYLLFQSVQLSINTYLVVFAKEQLLLTALSSGILLAILQVSGAFGRAFWGVLSDKAFHGNRASCLATVAMIEAALLWYLSMFTRSISYTIVLIVVVLLGLTTLGWNGVAMAMVSESLGANKAGLATGAVLTIGFGGSVLFPPLIGWTVDWANTYKFAWLLSSALMVLASVMLFRVSVLQNRLRN